MLSSSSSARLSSKAGIASTKPRSSVNPLRRILSALASTAGDTLASPRPMPPRSTPPHFYGQCELLSLADAQRKRKTERDTATWKEFVCHPDGSIGIERKFCPTEFLPRPTRPASTADISTKKADASNTSPLSDEGLIATFLAGRREHAERVAMVGILKDVRVHSPVIVDSCSPPMARASTHIAAGSSDESLASEYSMPSASYESAGSVYSMPSADSLQTSAFESQFKFNTPSESPASSVETLVEEHVEKDVPSNTPVSLQFKFKTKMLPVRVAVRLANIKSRPEHFEISAYEKVTRRCGMRRAPSTSTA